MLAVIYGNEDVVRMLIDAHAKLEAVNDDGCDNVRVRLTIV